MNLGSKASPVADSPDIAFVRSCVPGGLIDRLAEPMAALSDEEQLRVHALEEAVQRLLSTIAAVCPHGSRFTARAIERGLDALDAGVRAIRMKGEV